MKPILKDCKLIFFPNPYRCTCGVFVQSLKTTYVHLKQLLTRLSCRRALNQEINLEAQFRVIFTRSHFSLQTL